MYIIRALGFIGCFIVLYYLDLNRDALIVLILALLVIRALIQPK